MDGSLARCCASPGSVGSGVEAGASLGLISRDGKVRVLGPALVRDGARRLRYGKQLITEPTLEPLTLAQVKSRLRVDQGVDDSELRDIWIPAVRRLVEAHTGRALITQQWLVTADRFPGLLSSVIMLPAAALPAGMPGFIDVQIELPIAPIQSVDSVVYADMSNTPQTLDPARYEYDANVEPVRLRPKFNTAWPSTYPKLQAVQVSVTAGYGDTPADIPADLRGAMLIQLADWYDGASPVGELSNGVKGILDLYWPGDMGVATDQY